ncbi:MAG TPA: CsbD family protein [Polyangiaceae bacterium]|nr:CsbD family protein [Polyangiaceae bacterium]
MNWDHIQGNWRELRGKLRSKWAKLTDDDLENIAGKKDILLGRLQQHYGIKKDEAERQLDAFLNDASPKSDAR